MNTDLSVAPEIAQLAAPLAPAARVSAAPRTDGRVAGDLADLAASPERWWDLVSFDPGGPLRIPLPGQSGRWLLVLPPGAVTGCDCEQATALAGEALEAPASGQPGRPLRPGRVLVHGRRGQHEVRAAGPGYSVSLHTAVTGTRSLSPIPNGRVLRRYPRPLSPGPAGPGAVSSHCSANSQPACGRLSGRPGHPVGVPPNHHPG